MSDEMEQITPESPAVFVNLLEVAPDDVDWFVARWKDQTAVLASADGFVSARLYRALGGEARFALVNVTRWRGAADFDTATRAPAFRAQLQNNAAAAAVRSHSGMYRIAAQFAEESA